MFLRDRLNISRWAINHPWLTISFWIALSVAGLLAFSTLKYGLFPEVAFPVVIVNATIPLNSVAATETQLTNPIEQQLTSLPNLTLYSSTYGGRSLITAAFDAGLNLDQSTQQVKTALENLKLPTGAKFEVFPFNLNESPAVTYAIVPNEKIGQSLEDLETLTQEQIIPRFSELAGVLRVNLLGDGNIRPAADPNLPDPNPPTLTRWQGQDVLAVQVIKKADANTLEVVREAQKAATILQKSVPNLNLVLAETQANYIQEATNATLESLMGAIFLAVLVIFPFLRSGWATLISAIAIPLSLLGTALVMAIGGFNLETLTLLALALVIGIVVDDAIVDVENISRHLEAGASPKQAAMQATEEIGLTVTATTLSIAMVFLPIALMGGTLGQFFKPFAITVTASVIFSLLVARTLSPVLAIFWLRPPKPGKKSQGFLEQVIHHYGRLLGWSLNHRQAVMGVAIASLIIGLALIPLIPQGFIPTLDRGEFNVVYSSALPKLAGKLKPENGAADSLKSSGGAFDWISEIAQSPERFLLRKTRRVAEKLEPTLLQNSQVESIFTVAGLQGNPLKGNIYTKLKSSRSQTTAQVQETVRADLPSLPKVTTSVENILFVQTGDDSPLKVALRGENLSQLQAIAAKFKEEVEKIPGLIQIKLTGADYSTEIEHFQGKRAVYLSANLSSDQALGNITEQVTQIGRSLLPQDITLELQGDSARIGQVFAEFALTLLLSLVAMLTVLVLLFQGFKEPLVIGLSLPLSIVGAMLGLLITQSDFGMISLIGLIFLLGLLGKNAILLIDYANHLRATGIERREALIKTGLVRFRPIVMTTGSTILGMLPLALGLGAGAELRQPMAVAIIGGLTTSSLLSLIVVPVLYTLVEDGWPKGLRYKND